jgi:UDP-N-acetylglucosamine 2-epimerase (non-hydrolysing)
MKVMTLLGTRPEIIRLCRVIEGLDTFCDHTLVHTGQNYDPALSDVLFKELGVRAPDVHLGIRADTVAGQIGQLLERCGELFAAERPDRLLILGDTNTGLAAVIGARMGIPVFHMEAGNRCYDDRVPEEINRRVIDHSSTVLMPYTQRSKDNLVREGIDRDRIFVTGNPIFEVLEKYKPQIDASRALDGQKVAAGEYFLVTLHRAENVDQPDRLRQFVSALGEIGRLFHQPILVSVHPRAADRMRQFGIDAPGLRLLTPLGFFDFVKLERHARAVLSDSGTVQEECAIFRVPNVTLRDVTERPETLECGSNVLSGAATGDVVRALRVALDTANTWTPPAEYLVADVSRAVLKLVLGYNSIRRHVDRVPPPEPSGV